MDRYIVVEIRKSVSHEFVDDQAISADSGSFQRQNLADTLMSKSGVEAADCYVVEHEIIDGAPTKVVNKYPAVH